MEKELKFGWGMSIDGVELDLTEWLQNHWAHGLSDC